jgi:hypothetical protein
MMPVGGRHRLPAQPGGGGLLPGAGNEDIAVEIEIEARAAAAFLIEHLTRRLLLAVARIDRRGAEPKRDAALAACGYGKLPRVGKC